MITVKNDRQAGELVITTPQGMILVNEHPDTHMTRVVLLPHQNGYVSMSEGQPAMMVMWAGVPIVEPDFCEDDTQKMLVPFYEDVEHP